MIVQTLTILLAISVFTIDDVVAPPPDQVDFIVNSGEHEVRQEYDLMKKRETCSLDYYSLGTVQSNKKRIDVCNLTNEAVKEFCKSTFKHLDEAINPNETYKSDAHKCERILVALPIENYAVFNPNSVTYLQMAQCPLTIRGVRYFIAEAVTDATVLLLQSFQSTDLISSIAPATKKVFPRATVQVPEGKLKSLLPNTNPQEAMSLFEMLSSQEVNRDKHRKVHMNLSKESKIGDMLDQAKQELERVNLNIEALQMKKAFLESQLQFLAANPSLEKLFIH